MTRSANLFSFLLLVIVADHLSPVSCNTFHVWNGKLAYYNGDREMNFNDTLELCSSLGGKLPSIHSSDDSQFISRLVGGNSRVWLVRREERLRVRVDGRDGL